MVNYIFMSQAAVLYQHQRGVTSDTKGSANFRLKPNSSEQNSLSVRVFDPMPKGFKSVIGMMDGEFDAYASLNQLI